MAWKRLEGILTAKVEGKGFHLGSEYASEGPGRAVAVGGGLQNHRSGRICILAPVSAVASRLQLCLADEKSLLGINSVRR